MKKLIGVKELAENINIKVSTVYSWVHSRQIPFVKLGRLVKFDIDDISEWLAAKRQDARGYDG